MGASNNNNVHRHCQSQHSTMAKNAIISNASCDNNQHHHHHGSNNNSHTLTQRPEKKKNLMPPSSKTVVGRALGSELHVNENIQRSLKQSYDHAAAGLGCALTDTPISTAPSSPQMYVSCFFCPLLSIYILLILLILAVTCCPGVQYPFFTCSMLVPCYGYFI